MKNSDLGTEEKVTEETTETEEEVSEETQEEPKEETQEEEVSEDDFFPKTDGDSEEESTSSDSEEDATSKEDDGQKETDLGLEDDLSVDDFDIDKQEKKSGVQKRIDQLVAEKKSLEERLEKVEKSTDDTSSKLPDYSEAQLRTAMNKAMEEGDANLMWEIMDYRVKKEKRNVLEANKKQQQEQLERQQRVAKEWHSTVEEYEYLSDDDEPEIYTGSHKDLNIKDKNSLLMQLATTLYQDPENAERYQKDGGQRLAISDAIRMILRKRNTKASSKENKKLKRKLAKEKRKSSVASGSSVKKKDKKPTTSGDSLQDYIKERKKLQHTGF